MNTTKCIVCGKNVAYKTKKPHYCPECRAAKKAPRKPKSKANKSPKSKWKSESYMYKVLRELMPKAEYCLNGYYSFLPSPKGEPMQLDWYSYELGLAFEYNGSQHYTHNKYFHKKKADFKYLQDCDKLKKDTCEKEGITLVEVRYDEEMNAINLARLISNQNPAIFSALIKDNSFNLSTEDVKKIKGGKDG